MAERIRTYVFTLNNYTSEEIDMIQKGDYTYIVYGKEVGESGTPHLQGFVKFENAKTMSAIHKLKGWKRTALKPAEKPLSAIDYCKKGSMSHADWELYGVKGETYGMDADVWECGAIPKQGARHDLEGAFNRVKDGESVDDVAWTQPEVYARCFKALDKLEDIRLRRTLRSEMTEGVWIYGKTGCGKSKMVFTDFTPETAYAYPYDGGWWDGYKQQPHVILDEFRGQIIYEDLLRMVDCNPNYFVRRRCREPMPFVSKKVSVTSSLAPRDIYTNLKSGDSLEQIYRRFKIYELIDGELIERDKYYFEEN